MAQIRPGEVDGKHHMEYVETVRELERKGRLQEAEALLWRLVEAAEAEAQAGGTCPAPTYYERLAIDYRKLKRYAAEVAVLEQYRSHLSPEDPTFAERLARARELLSQQKPARLPEPVAVAAPVAAASEPAAPEPQPVAGPPEPAGPIVLPPPAPAVPPKAKRRSGCLWFFLGAAAVIGLLVAALL